MLRNVAMAASFGIMTISTFIANLVFFEIIGRVNQVRNTKSQLPYVNFGWRSPLTVSELLREYRKFYPLGKLHRIVIILYIAAAIGFLSFAALLFIRLS